MATRPLRPPPLEADAVQARADVRQGFSLPAYYYADSVRYAEDFAILREKMWWIAGHISQIPKRGDYFLFNIDGESIIVTRGTEGAINAFYNVCRHRGSRVCLEASGSARLMVCPYHSWSYDSDGRLIGATDMPDWFDKREFGLHPVHVGVVEGLIFLCLARGEAPGFDAFVSRMKPFFAPYQLDRAKVIAQDLLPCPANWKLVIENFAECYHCPGSHKEYARTHRVDSMMLYTDGAGGEVAWIERMKMLGLFDEPVFDDIGNRHFQSAIRLQIGGTSISGGASGQAVAPRMGNLSDWSGAWSAAVFNPMCQIACYDDHAILFSFVPRGPASTDCIVTWLVRQDAVEGVDYKPDEVAFMWRHTIQEDKAICENNQLGVSSSAYRPGPYSLTESRASSTVEWYLRHFVDGPVAA